MWVDLDVYNLKVVGASDVDEGVELYADWALKSCEHGVGNGVIKGDDILGGVGCGVSFLVGYDVRAVGAGRRVGVAREKLSSMRWMEVRNVLDAARPLERACWR